MLIIKVSTCVNKKDSEYMKDKGVLIRHYNSTYIFNYYCSSNYTCNGQAG